MKYFFTSDFHLGQGFIGHLFTFNLSLCFGNGTYIRLSIIESTILKNHWHIYYKTHVSLVSSPY